MSYLKASSLLLIFSLIMISCEKNTDRLVEYRITDSVSGFDVRYLDETGKVVTDKVTTQSATDVWKYSFTSEDGGIVFVSANYKDPASAVKVLIMVDGKVYKQAASKKDTISFVTASGVIPFRE